MDSTGTAFRIATPIPLAEIGHRGRMTVTFALQDGQTILQDSYCEIPFKLTRILNPSGTPAHLILMYCSAGLFGGDDVECSIRAERGSRVWITQQSATKIHPSQNRVAIQRHQVSVE